MKQEEKELLLKDLCSRLTYGIFVKENRESLDDSPTIYTFDYHPCIDNCKPYLRPMSSMTNDEMVEFDKIKENPRYIPDKSGISLLIPSYVDWLNEHYFDYRGLIEKGLALEAPEGMYK